ncbi:hypothetical protein LINPERHAP1_LOCUS12013 [Linum perenne]
MSTDPQPIVGVLAQPFSNRVLVAYEHGLLLVWDAIEARVIFVGGEKDLELKETVLSSRDEPKPSSVAPPEEDTSCSLEGKEISALCWASSDGSILAVGYVDGDILFWKTPISSSKDKLLSSNIVKLQLSSAEKRLPVIVLNWCSTSKSSESCNGQLFVYGGVAAGSDELLTILTLEWSTKADSLLCAGRLDLTLTGSFADMIVLPRAGSTSNNHRASLTVLTNPGQLHRFDGASLNSLLSRHEKKTMVIALEFSSTVPTLGPPMTTTKLVAFPMLETSLKPSVERMYIAGYRDGSVRVWNASSPVLSLLCHIEAKVQGVELVGFDAPVSTLDLCRLTLLFAVGTEHGMVRVYNLRGDSSEESFWFVTENTREIKPSQHQGKGPNCKAVFALLHSPIEALQFSSSGAKLAAGFGCGRTAVLDMSSFSVLFLTAAPASTPLISVKWIDSEEVILVLTKDAGISVVDADADAGSGKMIRPHPWHPKKKSTAISLCIIEGRTHLQNESNDNEASDERSTESLILLSCEKSLRLYTTKSVIEGNRKAICKVKHSDPCAWTETFEKDGEVVGVISLFTTGVIELRSFPGLELVKESSLNTILRWSFKNKMEKTMSCDSGHITLVNGCELAFISLLSGENCFRIPESLPSLHNKTLANAAFKVSSNLKKKQDIKPGILTRLAKSFKVCKPDHITDAVSHYHNTANAPNLEDIFAKPPPLPDSSRKLHPEFDSSLEKQEELDIDDIEIDDPPLPPPVTDSSKQPNKTMRSEREQLLGSGDDVKPRIRTHQEIIATYRKAEDASSAASQTRNKLLQRQDKLERINRRTAELRNEAEDFASLANELVKVMEKRRKWWHI